MIRRLGLLLVALLAALVVAPVAAQAAPSDTVKVYVVRQGDSLPLIAQRTLGDQNRAQEIFDLNKGRVQGDGGALTNPNDLHPGWILRLPDDASGRFVQLGRISATADKSYFTWKVVLALIGAVVLALITVVVVFRRRVWKLFGGAYGRIAGGFALRRRIGQRRRLRDRLAAGFVRDDAAISLAYRSAAELDAAGAEAYALRTGNREVTAWVTSDRPPSPWRAVTDDVWVRSDAASVATAPATAPCLVRPGGSEDGFFFADLNWLDGVLAIGGDPAVASEALTALLTDLSRVRPDVRVLSMSDIRPSRVAATEGDGMLLLAARRRALTAVIVVRGPISDADAGRLLEHCGQPGSTEAAIVLGDLPGAHWRWTADAEGTVRLPVFNTTVTVPAS